MRNFIALIFVALAGISPAFGQSSTPFADSLFKTGTVTAAMLERSTTRTNEVVAAYGLGGNVAASFDIDINGTSYSFKTLSIGGYTNLFRDSGGPTLRTVGLDFRSISDPTHWFFYAYNAFLVLMVGFYWFNMIDNVSKGKGHFDVIPLLLKFCVGMLVCYNLPTVYAIAMVMKDVGNQVVLTTLLPYDNGNPSQAASNLLAGSVNNLVSLKARDDAIREALEKQLNLVLLPIQYIPRIDPTTGEALPEADLEKIAQNSGRKRLAALTARLNQKILDYVAKTSKVTSFNEYDEVKSTLQLTTKDIDSVGFDGNVMVIQNPFVNTDGDYPPDVNLNKGDSLNADMILAKYANSTTPANHLTSLYASTLLKYIRLQANSYTSSVWNLNYTDLLTSFGGPINTPYISTANDLLGDSLKDIDTVYTQSDRGDDALQKYKEAIIAQVSDYFSWNLANPTLLNDTAPTAVSKEESHWYSFITNALSYLSKIVLSIPQAIADVITGVVKRFWIPALAHLADAIFNFTIEMYVYILFLAYPFWFSQKTAKAFTGAINTLIAVSFTSATFCVLTLMFDGFAAQILQRVLGAPAGAISGGATVGAAAIGGISTWGAPVAIGMIVGVSIGYAIFYMVGTFLCFKLAPKIFKAFLEGSSVVTPMIGAATTAVVSGAVGGLLAGVGAGVGAAAVGGLVAKSATAKALGSTGFGKKIAAAGQKVGSWKSSISSGIRGVSAKAQRALGTTEVGRGIRKDLKSMGSAAGAKWEAIKKDPKQALINLAGSKAVQAMAVSFAGLSGNPVAPLKALAEITLVTTSLEKLSERGGAHASATREIPPEAGGVTTAASGQGGAPVPPQNETVKKKVVVEAEVEVKKTTPSTGSEPPKRTEGPK